MRALLFFFGRGCRGFGLALAQLSRGDAVCTHNLAEFVNHHIMGLQARLGPAGYEALIATVDPSIMQQLTTFMTGLAAVEAQ